MWPPKRSMDERPVVSNTTPLITLVGVGQLALLPALYRRIWIPQAVADEYHAGAGPDHPQLATLPWLEIRPTTIEPALRNLLDLGEAAAVSLATAAVARLVILDETRGRRVAQQRQLALVGSLGVLLRAKQHGLIGTIAPIIDAMVAQGRFLAPALRKQVLQAAGEPTNRE